MNTKHIKMEKVMIALDCDPTAQKVAEVGYAMAKAMNAHVILIHVLSNPVYYASTEYSPIMGYTGYIDTGGLQLDSIEGLTEAAQIFLDKAKEHLGDETIQTVIKEGDFADSIIEEAKYLDVDVIVMGSLSRKWLENLLLGSVTEKVVHHSTIPIFVVPTKKSMLIKI